MIKHINQYKHLTIIAVILSVFLMPYSAKAANPESIVTQTLKVSPFIIKLNIDPGKIQNYPINVTNLSNNPIPLKVSVEGFDASDEDYGISSKDNVQSPLIKWISIDKEDAIIPANSTQTFNATISIPEKVALGGYYAVIFFNPLASPQNPQINSRIGIITLANIGVQEDQKGKISIPTFEFKDLITGNNPVQTTIRVRNDSLNYFSAKPILTIKPLFGKIQEFPFEDKTILPGKIRRWEKSINLDNLWSGVYIAKLRVVTEKGNQIIITKNLYVFPPKKQVTIALLLPFILFLLFKRKRITKAFKILVTGKNE